MLPFLAAFVDFNSSPETFEKYDKMSALELFVKCGVSKAAYEEFLRPTLLVVRETLAFPHKCESLIFLRTPEE
jgi:hypothetical protein